MKRGLLLITIVIGILLSVCGHGLCFYTEEWVYLYNGPTNNHDRFDSLTYGEDGNLYMVGFADHIYPAQDGDLVIVSLTPDNTERWFLRYPLSDYNLYYAIDWGSDGNIYAGGLNMVISVTPDATERWVYSGCTVVKALTYGDDGNVYVCSGNDVISLSNGGILNWTYPTTGAKYDVVYGQDNNIYTVGATVDLSGKFEVTSITPSGTENWTYTYEASSADDLGFSLVYGTDGNTYAT
ncbi:hypothetical protein K8T06_01505, partial [bacterium]|nr:hypothetical protein [bacterium]